MGNFSVNHYAKIKIGDHSVEILYLVDMAEIPTYQEIRQSNLDPKEDERSADQYLATQEQLLGKGLTVEIDGQAVVLRGISRHLQFASGAGGLPTMTLSLLFRGAPSATAKSHRLMYVDNNFPGRAGWKEVVVVSDEVAIVDSSAPATDRSQELTHYSSDLINSPPQQLSATINYQVATPAVASTPATVASGLSLSHVTRPAKPAPHAPIKMKAVAGSQTVAATSAAIMSDPDVVPSAPTRSQNTPRSRFTELISTQGRLSFWVLLSAALIAAGLGALHALEPGHGKTIVAAYLVGSRGTARHAVLLGVVVTAAHTAGVYLLGVVTLYASRYIVPEQLYPWLGAISGISVAGLGVFVLLRNVTGETGEHSHLSGKSHSHWFLSSFQTKRSDERFRRSQPTAPCIISR